MQKYEAVGPVRKTLILCRAAILASSAVGRAGKNIFGGVKQRGVSGRAGTAGGCVLSDLLPLPV